MRNVWQTRTVFDIFGVMPERALLRLRRANIPLYDIQKLQKNQLRLSVRKKDEVRVFAVYPKVGEDAYAPYTVRVVGGTGVGKYLDFAKKRVGFVLGLCLFCGVVAYADGLVLGVDFSASSVYAREAYATLEKYGVKKFSQYKKGNEDLICSQLLSLEGVEFCSVKKSGMRLIVEMRLGDLPPTPFVQGDMQAAHTGKILAITALKGTPQKGVGEDVRSGETLVGAWIESGEERKKTEVIARASIACTYECVVQTEDEKIAFCTAYLQAGLDGADAVTQKRIERLEKGYAVRIEYVAIQSMNF